MHLSREALDALFGEGYELTERAPLSQPGQFAAEETVDLIGPKRTIERVRAAANACVFRRLGPHCAGGRDDIVRRWDVATGECIQYFEGHGMTVTAVCTTATGLVLSAGWDCTIRVWDTLAGECLTVLEGHSSSVTGLGAREVCTSGRLTAQSDDTSEGARTQALHLRAISAGHRGQPLCDCGRGFS